MNTVKFFAVCALGLLLLHGCGFQLRGVAGIPIEADSLYLDLTRAGDTGREVRQQLEAANIHFVDNAKEADFIIQISNEHFQRNVLSVSPRTGRVQEYELVLSAILAIADKDGQPLIESERVAAERDYFFDETAVVAGFDEQRLIRDELARQVAYQIMLRLQSVTTQHRPATAAAH